MMNRKINLILLLLVLLPLWAHGQNHLRFKEGRFKIAQLTDLHWTPQSPNCEKTAQIIRSVLSSEQPDLVVLTGDVVTDDPAEKGWKAIIELLNEARIPFAVTMGNHDAEHMEKEAIYDLLLQSPYFIGDKGPKGISGCGNTVIPLYGSGSDNNVAALLYCIDSNDYVSDKTYGHYDWIHFDQIEWYRHESDRFTKANQGKPLPALAFFHIPLLEFNELAGDSKTFGQDREGAVASSEVNSGMFSAFIDQQDVMGVFVGHDHDSDYLGINKGIALAYGRVTGIDAYGSLERGARIIELYENQFKFDSWVSTPKGREPSYYYPSGLNASEEAHLPYLPAKAIHPKKQGVAYTYYEGKCKSVADMDTCRLVKQGVMKNISIDDAEAEDYFAYEFKAYLQIPERGVYRFFTYSDDGSQLFIDGQLVVDNDGGHSARRREGKIALEKGFHELRLLYFESYMGQTLELGYTSKQEGEILLPAERLFVPED